ncbi:MAG: sulfite oxidase [Burkholderiales bacterium]|nr:sulfite oxidase [Burkholderiales bacterium]
MPEDRKPGFEGTRRRFLERIGAGSALALAGAAGLPREALAQAPAPQPEPQVPGTIANASVLAGKDMSVFQVHSERPLTGSVPADAQDFDVTPSDRMFVRNNLLTPDIDAATARLRVVGLVDKPLDFGVEELKKAFPAVTMQGMVECAGAGRTAFQPVPRGTPWSPTGGMGCPKWTGVRLRDVLNAAGLKANAAHVAGQGGDPGAVPTAAPVIRSIPLAKAMDEHTLIAWAMNDAPLPKIHGYPLRLVVPGWVGSASTKWLHTLTLLDAPFKGTFMDDSYRVPKFPVAPGEKMPADTLYTEAWPIKSMITSPAPNARLPGNRRIVVRGKAWVGEGRVARVEISTDEGVTWQRASLGRQGDKYAWRTFTFEYEPQRLGYMTFLARAWDDRDNAQPIVSAWNPLGYFWNGVHRVGIVVVPA